MADTRLAEAIDAIARDIIADRALNYGSSDLREDWERWPDIAEHDWDAVIERVNEIVTNELKHGQPKDYVDAAYSFLSGRAENG